MKRHEWEWLLITVTAAGLTAALLVSCAPTHRSYVLGGAPQVSDNAPKPQTSPAVSLLAGNWLCESDCSIDEIALQGNGSAVADGETAQLSIQPKGQSVLHVALSVPAHDGMPAATLDGDVNTSASVDQLTLGGATYAREQN